MKEKQRITITGRHWADIVKLPCFRKLTHYGAWELNVIADYIDGKPASYEEEWYGTLATAGDTLVEYEGGKWGIIRKEEPCPR